MAGYVAGSGGSGGTTPVAPSRPRVALRHANRIATETADELRSDSRRGGLAGVFTLWASPTTAQAYQQAIQQELSSLRAKANTVTTFDTHGYSTNPLPDGSESPEQAAERRAAESARSDLAAAGITSPADIAAFGALNDQQLGGIAAEQGRVAGQPSMSRTGWRKLASGILIVGGLATADQVFANGRGLDALGSMFGHGDIGSNINNSGLLSSFGDAAGGMSDFFTNGIGSLTGMDQGNSKILGSVLSIGLVVGATVLGRERGGMGLSIPIALAGSALVYSALANSSDHNLEDHPIIGGFVEHAERIGSGYYSGGQDAFGLD